MNKRKLYKPKKIDNLLNQTLKKYGLFDKIKEQYIYIVWQEEVGENVSAHAKPAFFKYGKLFVNVDSSAWLNELKFMKEKIVKKLNEKLGINKVREIIFKIK